MKKVFGFLALGVVGWMIFKPKDTSDTTVATGTPPANSVSPYEKAHVTALDNGYSLIVHNGVLYYDDKPGFFEMYVAQFGQKEMTVPVFETFAQQFPAQKSLSELFA